MVALQRLVVVSAFRLQAAYEMARPRLLCFPGKASTGSGFSKRLERLQSIADLTCVDAPHPEGGGFSWWLLPPGERSFTTPVFEGWEKTVAFVQKAWLEQGNFDGMVGFSQGAILIAALAAIGVLRGPSRGSTDAGPEERTIFPKFLILAGAAVPGPFRMELTAVGVSGLRCLHVIGLSDDVNPPDGARQVAVALGGAIWEHSGKHDIPMDDVALARYAEFLTENDFAEGDEVAGPMA